MDKDKQILEDIVHDLVMIKIKVDNIHSYLNDRNVYVYTDKLIKEIEKEIKRRD